MERIAVIGSGIAGLAAARRLMLSRPDRLVSLFEADERCGGHAHTVDVTIDGVSHGVDTGFLVYNERTYPGLVRLFAELGVETAPSDMSFSVQVRSRGLAWSGSSLNTVFAQRSNLLRPRFWTMLGEIARFNRLTTAIARRGEESQLAQPIGAFLDEHGFGAEFREWYFLPMIGCIWSCPTAQMLSFPIATLIRFCHNHGLLQVTGRPQWHTVRGGSRHYVRRIVEGLHDVRTRTPVTAVHRGERGVAVHTRHQHELFDQVVFACHSDQALRLLGEGATLAERMTLGAVRYHPNRAVLHTDASLLPRERAAWAAWNYEASGEGTGGEGVCLHYLINKLQPLPWQQPVIVSLNPVREPKPDSVIRSFEYAHPIFDLDAIAAQRRLSGLQGLHRSWFCGAWTGYGFHEDGLQSGEHVAQAIDALRVPAGGPAVPAGREREAA